jgi:mannose-6-phosphate isomerase-like protein (cupin superfamily)
MVEPSQPLIKATDVRSYEHTPGGTVRFFHGDEHDLGDVSVAMSSNPPGGDGLKHRHPCGEVFVVYEGRGVYTVGDSEVVAEPGDIVVVPPNTWHSFRAEGDVSLCHVAVFDTAHVATEMHAT